MTLIIHKRFSDFASLYVHTMWTLCIVLLRLKTKNILHILPFNLANFLPLWLFVKIFDKYHSTRKWSFLEIISFTFLSLHMHSHILPLKLLYPRLGNLFSQFHMLKRFCTLHRRQRRVADEKLQRTFISSPDAFLLL